MATGMIRIVTDVGAIVIALFGDVAPITVENFLAYVDAGHYQGATFYRATQKGEKGSGIDVIQGGRYRDLMAFGGYELASGPYPPIAHEPTSVTGLSHVDGAVSMARLAPGSATSEFFICIGDNLNLDFGGSRNPDGQGFAVFGQVIEGMDVVRAIQAQPTDAALGSEFVQGEVLQPPIRILTVARIQMDRAGAAGAPWQEILLGFPNQGSFTWLAQAQGRWYATNETPACVARAHRTLHACNVRWVVRRRGLRGAASDLARDLLLSGLIAPLLGAKSGALARHPSLFSARLNP